MNSDQVVLKKDFCNSDFGDKRLNKRFEKICAQFQQKPLALINHVIQDAHQCKAAYRFWINPKVTTKKILESHHKCLEDELKREKVILEIQDTTELDFSDHFKTENLGDLGNRKSRKKGLECHSSIIVTEEGLCLGIGSMQLWARKRLKNGKKDRRQIPLKDKESIKWLNAIDNFETAQIPNLLRITVADREADFYELYDYINQNNQKMIIRLRWDRKTTERQSFKSEVLNQQIVGTTTIKTRARGGLNAREEKETSISIRFVKKTILPPKNLKKEDIQNSNLTLTLIHVIEDSPREGEEPIEWYLLTNLETEEFKNILQIIRWYSFRWLVEEFHKILKAGIGVESARLGTRQRLEKFITLLGVIAARILWMSRIGRIDPGGPSSLVITEEEEEFLIWKFPKKIVSNSLTINESIRLIAMLGGFLGRKSDKEPGLLTLWRGWMRFLDMMEGTQFKSSKRCG